jgi:hypothetical protein
MPVGPRKRYCIVMMFKELRYYIMVGFRYEIGLYREILNICDGFMDGYTFGFVYNNQSLN